MSEKESMEGILEELTYYSAELLNSLTEETIEKVKEHILKSSREEMKRELKRSHDFIDLRRYWEEFLALNPEIKTTQPELYNKLLILCDVLEELEIKERRDSLGGLVSTGVSTGFKIGEIVFMILLAILGIAFVVTLVRSML